MGVRNCKAYPEELEIDVVSRTKNWGRPRGKPEGAPAPHMSEPKNLWVWHLIELFGGLILLIGPVIFVILILLFYWSIGFMLELVR